MSCLNNAKYKEMVVDPNVYVPETNIDYPTDDPYRRLLTVDKNRQIDIDENYPYYDDSEAYLKERRKCYLICNTWCKLVQTVKWGFRVRGRDILKKYKKEFANGAMTICNHAYRWDMVSVIHATRKKFYLPVYGENMMTNDYWWIKYIGGIPVPSSMAAMKKFNEAFDKYHEQGEWLHVFPEATRWNFYKPLKPFKKGAFSMSYKYAMPILPCCITYRKRTGIYKLFGKADEPLITITIGEPIFPDMNNARKVEVERLRKVAHMQMQKMAGIIHNTWPIAPDNGE